MDQHIFVFFVTLLLLANKVESQTTCTSPTDRCSCSIGVDGLKTIDCRYKSLTAIPPFSPRTDIYDKILFTSLEETGTCQPSRNCNNINNIPADAFANLNVKLIDLRNNPIKTFDESAFSRLNTYLETILLEGDGTNEPPYTPLTVLSNLRKLHLEHFNQTEMTTASSYLNFKNLKSLTLKKIIGLTTINADVFLFLTNLTEFTLDYLDDLKMLPVSAILQLRQLTHLTIIETGIKEIFGGSLLDLQQLQEVYIERNFDLDKIDVNAFRGVQDIITFVVLSNNKLTSGSLDFLKSANWSSLTQLDLGYNPLGSIPASTFSTMPVLAKLSLTDVRLTAVDSSMFNGLWNLHTLDLAYNEITHIATGAFQNSPTLSELRLNKMSKQPVEFSEHAFQGIESSLEILWLENNRIDLRMFWENIANLTNLIHLNVANISISEIPDYAFINNKKLETIDFTDNNITTLKQETFHGPRTTLKSVNLINNKIQTIGKCVLSDFAVKPKLTLSENSLNCDCRILWLYDWVIGQSDINIIYTTGPCTSPASLAGKFFNQFNQTDLVCPQDYQEPECPDLYATTTTSTTTTSTTTPTTTTTTTVRPMPIFEILIAQQADTFIKLTWTITDKTDLTGYKLEMTSNYKPKEVRLLHKDENEYTFLNLQPESFYYFCLILELNNIFEESQPSCKQGKTQTAFFTSTSSTTGEKSAESQNNIGVIVGSAVGAVVLVAIIIVILYILLKSNKQQKRPPMAVGVTFTPRADIPHAGGTSRRFAKKPQKEGASPDDISVNVISSGDMNNRDRISAGSYQYLNEKDPRKVNNYPNPPNYDPPPAYDLNGHYANNVDNRPLPKAPFSEAGPSGANGTGRGYVNTGFQSVELHAPETSTNQYSEVKY